jgi:hypothetical protein
MKALLHISAVLLTAATFLLLGTSVRGQGMSTRFEAALKKEILRDHNRHIPKISISGNEVRLTYGDEEWTKDPAFSQEAKSDALNCFKADYAAFAADPRHRLHDYFHVIEYSTWSHQVIGEATLMRADYPSAQAVDEAELSNERFGK